MDGDKKIFEPLRHRWPLLCDHLIVTSCDLFYFGNFYVYVVGVSHYRYTKALLLRYNFSTPAVKCDFSGAFNEFLRKAGVIGRARLTVLNFLNNEIELGWFWLEVLISVSSYVWNRLRFLTSPWETFVTFYLLSL